MSSGQNAEVSDGKLATEQSEAGVNSITNTIGMHPSANDTPPQVHPTNNTHRG